MTKEEIEKEQMFLKIKALKGNCKKQAEKIKNQKDEIEHLCKKIIKQEFQMSDMAKREYDVIHYIDKLLAYEGKLDLDAVIITIKFMLMDTVEEKEYEQRISKLINRKS